VRGFKGLSVAALDFLPSSKQILGKAPDGTLTIWDGHSGQVVRTFKKGPGHIETVAVSPDGRNALTSGWAAGDLRGWHIPDGKPLWTRERSGYNVDWFTFQPGGHLAFLGDRQHGIRLWDVLEGKAVMSFDRGPRWGTLCAFSPDGKLVAADVERGDLEHPKKAILVLAEVPTGKVVSTFAERTGGADTPGNAEALAFSDDGKQLFSADGDFAFRHWDVATGRQLWSIDYRHPYWGGAAPALSRDGRLAVSVAIHEFIPTKVAITLELWDMTAGRIEREEAIETVP
jgi:WD40 repeat protein